MSTIDGNLSTTLSMDNATYIGNEFEYDCQYIRVKTETNEYCLNKITILLTELQKIDRTLNINYITTGEYQGYFKINSNNNLLIDTIKTKLLEFEKDFLNKRNNVTNVTNVTHQL